MQCNSLPTSISLVKSNWTTISVPCPIPYYDSDLIEDNSTSRQPQYQVRLRFELMPFFIRMLFCLKMTEKLK